MKTRLLLSCLWIFIIVTSCQKDQLTISDECDKWLCFEDQKEFQQSIQEVQKMTRDERILWETEMGFESYGLEAESFYESIDPAKFQSIDDVKTFVNGNSYYLKLVPDGNGEYELDMNLGSKSERYLINKHHMYQIGDTLFKVYEDGIVKGSIQDQDIFMSEMSLDAYLGLDGVIVSLNNVDPRNGLKSTNSGCGTGATWRETYNAERLKLEIWVDHLGEKIECKYLVRPYNKVLGVWYWCSRTMSVSVNFEYVFYGQTGQSQTGLIPDEYSENIPYRFDNSISGGEEVSTGLPSNPFIINEPIYFTKYTVNATHENANVADISDSCN